MDEWANHEITTDPDTQDDDSDSQLIETETLSQTHLPPPTYLEATRNRNNIAHSNITTSKNEKTAPPAYPFEYSTRLWLPKIELKRLILDKDHIALERDRQWWLPILEVLEEIMQERNRPNTTRREKSTQTNHQHSTQTMHLQPPGSVAHTDTWQQGVIKTE